jgi:hypothetical protein
MQRLLFGSRWHSRAPSIKLSESKHDLLNLSIRLPTLIFKKPQLPTWSLETNVGAKAADYAKGCNNRIVVAIKLTANSFHGELTKRN